MNMISLRRPGAAGPLVGRSPLQPAPGQVARHIDKLHRKRSAIPCFAPNAKLRTLRPSHPRRRRRYRWIGSGCGNAWASRGSSGLGQEGSAPRLLADHEDRGRAAETRGAVGPDCLGTDGRRAGADLDGHAVDQRDGAVALVRADRIWSRSLPFQ